MKLNSRTEYAGDTKNARKFASDGGILGNLYIPNAMWDEMGQPFVIRVDVVDGDEYVMHKVTYRYVKFKRRLLPGQALRRMPMPYVLVEKRTWEKLGQPYGFSMNLVPVLPKD